MHVYRDNIGTVILFLQNHRLDRRERHFVERKLVSLASRRASRTLSHEGWLSLPCAAVFCLYGPAPRGHPTSLPTVTSETPRPVVVSVCTETSAGGLLAGGDCRAAPPHASCDINCCGQIPNMTPITERPPKVATRAVSSHWKGDFARNGSAIAFWSNRPPARSCWPKWTAQMPRMPVAGSPRSSDTCLPAAPHPDL